MSDFSYKRIAVKIGSNVLSTKEGSLNLKRMEQLVAQISALLKNGIEVVLISSGAVASGRNIVKPETKLDAADQRQLFSAVGQAILINHYQNFFKNNNIICGQILTTKENFSSRKQYLNQKNCIEIMLANKIIPIINENDTISLTELMFTDNDELSGLIASMCNVDALIILSNVDGIYNGNPENPASIVIKNIKAGTDLKNYILPGKSSFGRGGMLTKVKIAKKVAEEGIPVYIANGTKKNIITNIIEKEDRTVYTKFDPGEKTSAVKKWIAHSEDFIKGKIYINDNCKKVLKNPQKATSILPVGITKAAGLFEKGDVISILDKNGQQIGVGKAQYGSKKLSEIMGQKGEKAIIHYDYLYLD